MALSAGAVVAQFDGDFKGLNKGLQQAEAKVNGFVNGISGGAKAIGGAFLTIGKMAAVAGAAVGGVAVVMGNKAANSASDLAEAQNAVNVVFKDSANILLDFAKTADKTTGLSQKAFLGAATPIGAALQNVGLNSKQAAGEAVNLTKRAADLASIFNTDLNSALTAIQAGLRGEADPLERFGVGLSDANIKTYALKTGIASAGKEMTDQQKVTARLGLFFEQTNKIQGDFVNTSDQLANKQRINAARFENLQATIGEKLLPTKLKLADALGKVLDWMDQNSEGIGNLLNNFITAGAGIAKSIFEALIKAPELAGQAMNKLLDFIKPFMPFLTVLGGTLLYLGTQVLAAFKYAWEQLKDPVMQLWTTIKDFWVAIQPILIGLGVILVLVVLPMVQMAFAAIVQIIKGTVTIITGLLNLLSGSFNVIFGIIAGIMTGNFSGAVEGFKQIFRGWGQWMQGAINIVLAPFKGLMDGIKNTVQGIDFFGIAVNWMNSLINGIKSKAGGIGGAVKSAIGGILPEGVRKLIPGFADGVRNFSGGLAVVGERGPELVNLPKGADVFTNEESRKMTAGGGGITIETMNIKSGVDWEIGASYLAQKLRLS
jgi:hypothetical protein